MRFFRVEVPLFIALMVSWVHGQDCDDVMLTANSGVFTSPNYPDEYDHELSCSWTITASPHNFVQLSFVKFDMKSPFLKCKHDYVTIDNGTGNIQTFCNNHQPHDVIKSVGTVMKVILKTDDFFRNGKGFKASYDIVDKDGNPLDKKDEEETDDETADVMTTSSKSAPVMTTSSKSAPKKSTEKSLHTTTVLLTKLSKATTKRPHTTVSDDSNSNEGQSGDSGKTSGFVIGGIVVVIVAVISIICAIAFSRYRKNKNKRISLSVIATPDDKELINNGKIYKKIGNKVVKDPEAETFPL